MSTTVTTYITQAEADILYPNGVDANASLRALALQLSFGHVNSYLNSELSLPSIPEWDGESAAISAPSILKTLQTRFYRWEIETANFGQSDELQELWDKTVEICKGVTQNELSISPTEVTPKQAGWHLVGLTNAQAGSIQIRGVAPQLKTNYKLTGLNLSTQYVSGVTYDVYRSDSATKRNSTAIAADFNWKTIEGLFEIRFDGRFQASWEARIVGIPVEMVNVVTKSNTIQQAPVGYGYYTNGSKGFTDLGLQSQECQDV